MFTMTSSDVVAQHGTRVWIGSSVSPRAFTEKARPERLILGGFDVVDNSTGVSAALLVHAAERRPT